MNKKIAFGFTAFATLLLVSVVGTATLNSIYNPVSNENVPIDEVSMDELKKWISMPGFERWNEIKGVKQYLQKHGLEYDEIKEANADKSRRELVSMNTNKAVRQFRSQELSGKAITNIQCNKDGRELEFTLTNTGTTNWFLVPQELTSGRQGVRKYLSGARVAAKTVQLNINNRLVNGNLPVYQNGERLFYDKGESFGIACQADFLRKGQSVDCELEPIPIREGVVPNSYSLNGPGFYESGTFTCS